MSLKDTSIKSTTKRVLNELVIALNEYSKEYPNISLETALQSHKGDERDALKF